MNARSWVILDVSLKTHLPVSSCQIQKNKPRLEILTEKALTVQNLLGWEKEKRTVHLLGRQRRVGRRGSVLCVEQTICKPCLTGFGYA